MKRFILFSMLLLAVAVLAGCSSGTEAAGGALESAASGGSAQQAVEAEGSAPQAGLKSPDTDVAAAESNAPAGAAVDETLVDEQGAVAVAVTPLNVGQAGTTLDFEVAMNTHSVDLSMDLAALATLTTDTGTEVAASSWDAPPGGHHVTGVLSFPMSSPEARLLDGATAITLKLVDVDAPARTFTWSLK